MGFLLQSFEINTILEWVLNQSTCLKAFKWENYLIDWAGITTQDFKECWFMTQSLGIPGGCWNTCHLKQWLIPWWILKTSW